MVELSTGVVSALIAFGIAAAQFLLPNALALILTGNLDRSHSAVTWSVVSRFLLSTDWPLFLRSDHATSNAVAKRVSVVTWTKPVGLFIIAIAAVVTPLGLYDEVAPRSQPRQAHFIYAADTGILGVHTMDSTEHRYNFSRICNAKGLGENYGTRLCPGDPDLGKIEIEDVVNSTTNETKLNYYFRLPERISPNLVNLYQSGLNGASPSLSSYFDIQLRSWKKYVSPVEKIEHNSTLLMRDFESVQLSTLLDKKVEIVEGLIVDNVFGGIGFRNHSVPADDFEYGSEWEEDILWMQPESACINTNMTAVWTGSLTDGDNAPRAELVDRGGFCNIQKANPFSAWEAVSQNADFPSSQANPGLRDMAFYLAWRTNALSMEYLNVTDPDTNMSRVSSVYGQKFNVSSDATYEPTDMNYFVIGSSIEKIVTKPPSASDWNQTNGNYTGYNGHNFLDDSRMIRNPHNVTAEMFSEALHRTIGAGVDKTVSVDRLDVWAGSLAGPAFVKTQSDPTNSSSSITYERPIFVCTAATKISVKTVRFRYNATRTKSLHNLEVKAITDKVYKKEGQRPLWGFETPQNGTLTWNLSMIDPLWGLVDASALDIQNVSTLRSDHFYLPASAQTRRRTGWSTNDNYEDYTPATTGPSACWHDTFEAPVSDWLEDRRYFEVIKASMQNTTAAENLLHLMWTDCASQAMIGTKGLHLPKYQPMTPSLRRRDAATGSQSLPDNQYLVYELAHHTRYRWIYAIPALLCAASVGLAVLMAFIGILRGHGTVARLRFFMFSISSGRVFATLHYPEAGDDRTADTKEWIDSVGHRQIRVQAKSSAVEERSPNATEHPGEYIRLRQSSNVESNKLLLGRVSVDQRILRRGSQHHWSASSSTIDEGKLSPSSRETGYCFYCETTTALEIENEIELHQLRQCPKHRYVSGEYE